MEIAPPNLNTVLIGNKCDLSDRRARCQLRGGRTFCQGAQSLLYGVVSKNCTKRGGMVCLSLVLASGSSCSRVLVQTFIKAARTVSKKIEDGVIDPSAKHAGLKLLKEYKPPVSRGGRCCT
ncbi:hypothetical protein BS78_01G472900 [Paspalum vaginatum]|nr:hypothetical protein BS78_01G472900 [Paspalum vaginatum]